MSNLAIAADIGSTFTKALAVDLDSPEIIDRVQHPTTIDEGVEHGFYAVRDTLKKRLKISSFCLSMASSSAHGGLNVVAIGLMPELTAKAAQTACLNAGARLAATYSHKLTPGSITEIDKLNPDIILLAGGTDGGDEEFVLHNAGCLRKLHHSPVILFAGNNAAADKAREICADRDFYVTDNVLPELDSLNIEPARTKIRDIFLSRIAAAKGLGNLSKKIDGDVIPTPLAFLNGVQSLSEALKHHSGQAEVLAIDVGGATTDVYSACSPNPLSPDTIIKGMPEPFFKRTVEGDIGIRHSLDNLLALRNDALQCQNGWEPDWAKVLHDKPDRLPVAERELASDSILAATAGQTALYRHCGRLNEHYSPSGKTLIQTGKDLRKVKNLIVSGGAFANNPDAAPKLLHLLEKTPPDVLAPSNPQVTPDTHYAMFAIGLFSAHNKELTLQLSESCFNRNAT